MVAPRIQRTRRISGRRAPVEKPVTITIPRLTGRTGDPLYFLLPPRTRRLWGHFQLEDTEEATLTVTCRWDTGEDRQTFSLRSEKPQEIKVELIEPSKIRQAILTVDKGTFWYNVQFGD